MCGHRPPRWDTDTHERAPRRRGATPGLRSDRESDRGPEVRPGRAPALLRSHALRLGLRAYPRRSDPHARSRLLPAAQTSRAARALGLDPEAAPILDVARTTLRGRGNILVSRGTGSGKTTLLNALIELLPADERIVSIEDALELRINHANAVRFEARELGTGSVTIRDLVKHSLRRRAPWVLQRRLAGRPREPDRPAVAGGGDVLQLVELL